MGSYAGAHGMSKREYFAGQIMAALCTQGGESTPTYSSPRVVAGNAVALADALLKALAQGD
jgi:hypothetical protein